MEYMRVFDLFSSSSFFFSVFSLFCLTIWWFSSSGVVRFIHSGDLTTFDMIGCDVRYYLFIFVFGMNEKWIFLFDHILTDTARSTGREWISQIVFHSFIDDINEIKGKCAAHQNKRVRIKLKTIIENILFMGWKVPFSHTHTVVKIDLIVFKWIYYN